MVTRTLGSFKLRSVNIFTGKMLKSPTLESTNRENREASHAVAEGDVSGSSAAPEPHLSLALPCSNC